MKFLFIVQGEGRGHMTQAISLSQKLPEMGHRVVAVCIGKSSRREIPDFVHKKIKAPIYLFDSPNFVADSKQKSVLIWKTFIHNLSQLSQFYHSLRLLDEQVQKHQPDVILNFYDMLGGFYNLIFRPKSQFWAIGHQYLIKHPAFPFAPNRPIEKLLFKLNTAITSLGAKKLMALSFRPYPPFQSRGFHILPPLLRQEIKQLDPSNQGFFLCYMVNPGYGQEVIQFASMNPDLQIVAFWDKKSVPDGYQPSANLTFYQVNDTLFLEKMAACRGLLSTAGFESICEAMSFGKPVMMVPVAGQYEQACNALDASLAGAGFVAEKFDFMAFHESLSQGWNPSGDTQAWFSSFDDHFNAVLPGSFDTKYPAEDPAQATLAQAIDYETGN